VHILLSEVIFRLRRWTRRRHGAASPEVVPMECRGALRGRRGARPVRCSRRRRARPRSR
jgi:hypothetical protein